jgi:hypothetical protein
MLATPKMKWRVKIYFTLHIIFGVGSSPIGGKRREKENTKRRAQIAGNFQSQIFPQ